MSKEKFLFSIKGLILLSPIPFGCATRIWSPLFYLILLLISGMTFWGIRKSFDFFYDKKIRFLGFLFFGFILLQLVPMPRFILKIISPATLTFLDHFSVEPVGFHSLALVPTDTLIFLVRLMVMVFFFYVLIHQDLEKRDIYSLIHVLMASALFQVFFGLGKYVLKTDKFFLFFYQTETPSRFLTGTFLNPGHLAFFLQIVFPLVIGIFLVKLYLVFPRVSVQELLWQIFFKRKDLIIYLITLFFLGIGIFYSKSLNNKLVLTMSVFLLAIGFINFQIKNSESIQYNLKWVVIGITLIVVLFTFQNTMANASRPDKEGNIRSMFWKDSMKIFSQVPILGTGFGNFKNISFLCKTKQDETKLTHVYNEYLENLVEGGVVGAGLFFAALGLLLASIFRIWMLRFHPEVKIMGLAIMVSLLSAWYYGWFEYAFRTPANGFLFILVLGLGLKMVLYKRELKHEK
jgi:O-antigen ligase